MPAPPTIDTRPVTPESPPARVAIVVSSALMKRVLFEDLLSAPSITAPPPALAGRGRAMACAATAASAPSEPASSARRERGVVVSAVIENPPLEPAHGGLVDARWSHPAARSVESCAKCQ